MSNSLQTAAEWLRAADRVVVFSGAGMSAESGIPTFRDEGGLWQEFPPEQFASWHGLQEQLLSDPTSVLRFLLALIQPVVQAEPHAGYTALNALQQQRDLKVITQNVDELHQRAGQTVVYEVHGSLFRWVDQRTQHVDHYTPTIMQGWVNALHAATDDISTLANQLTEANELQDILLSGGLRRPHMVLFGEPLHEPAWSLAHDAARECDVMLTVGTSLEVWPAAMLPEVAREAGARTIGIDPHQPHGDVALQGQAADVLPRLLAAPMD